MAAVALRQAFQRLGFPQDTANHTTDAANGEGMELEYLRDYSDNDVETLCSALKKPGGLIADAAGNMIVNPGLTVPHRAERNLKLLCYLCRHYSRTSRTVDSGSIQLALLNPMVALKAEEDDHEDPSTPMTLARAVPETITEFMANWPEHLSQYRGQTGVPLSYVIRTEQNPKAEADDPAYGQPNTVYHSALQEMEARAPITGATYDADTSRVWVLLQAAVIKHRNVYNWISSHARNQNGYAAWTAFVAHYRGSSAVENIVTSSRAKCLQLRYTGEKPRLTFEHYVSLHQKYHNDILTARPASAWDDWTRVRQLTDGIHANHMMAGIAAIKANPHYRTNFDDAVNLLRDFVIQTNPTAHNISNVQHGGRGGGGRGHGGGHGGGRGNRDGRGRGGGQHGRGGRGGGFHPYRGGGRGGRGGRQRARRDARGILIPEDRWYTREEWEELRQQPGATQHVQEMRNQRLNRDTQAVQVQNHILASIVSNLDDTPPAPHERDPNNFYSFLSPRQRINAMALTHRDSYSGVFRDMFENQRRAQNVNAMAQNPFVLPNHLRERPEIAMMQRQGTLNQPPLLMPPPPPPRGGH